MLNKHLTLFSPGSLLLHAVFVNELKFYIIPTKESNKFSINQQITIPGNYHICVHKNIILYKKKQDTKHSFNNITKNITKKNNNI